MRSTTKNLQLKLNNLALMFLSIVATLIASSTQLQAAEPVNDGGSNYAWWGINQSVLNANGGNNCRENFGIVANYHSQNVRKTVQAQLSTMFDNGQRRLRVPIYHATDVSTGTVLRSTGGDLPQQARNNLANFLADIKSAGYEEIIVGFFPISLSNPKNWHRQSANGNSTPYYNTAVMQENWSLIQNLRPIIIAAGIDYKIDLQNEGAAASNQPINRQYVRDIWALYNAAYGKADTIGFSIATGTLAERNNPDLNRVADLAVNRYTEMKQVYAESGYGDPLVWDFHAYQFLAEKIAKVDAAMVARGDTTDIMIGETFYQDPTTLNSIQNLSISRSIRAVYAWPVTTARGCDGHVDTAFPKDYFYGPADQAASDTNTGTTPQDSTRVTVQSGEQSVSAQVSVSQPAPACTSSALDPDGDGWGWENNASCQVTSSTTVTDTPVTSNTWPVCSSTSVDSDGDGWGWENNTSCLIR